MPPTPKSAKKRPAESAPAEDAGAGGDTSSASPAKKGRGRPKGSGTKSPKIPSGRGRGRPPLSAEEKAKRKADREAGGGQKKSAGRPKKNKK